MEEPTLLHVPAGEIAVWSSGHGPQALILHGGPGLSDYTEALADELASAFSCTRYQQRGCSPTKVGAPFSVETHVEDAVAVLDALAIERTLVVGHSWGGHLAMHLALAHPDRISGLLVVDPLGAVPDGGEEALGRALTARLSPADAARAQELDDRALAGEGSVEDAIEALRLVWPYYFAHPESAPPMPAMELSVECYADTVASIREHFDRGTLVDGLPGCDIPAVFVLGRESPIPYSEGVRTAELMQQARVEILDGCGHFPWLERPGSALAVAATLPNG
jgi:pimeloyl-ACP methyl ester carboxylesterase